MENIPAKYTKGDLSFWSAAAYLQIPACHFLEFHPSFILGLHLKCLNTKVCLFGGMNESKLNIGAGGGYTFSPVHPGCHHIQYLDITW